MARTYTTEQERFWAGEFGDAYIERSHSDRLFKRDWGGELMDRFGDLRLVDYGFIYHRATQFPGDDITWFLLER